MNRLVLEARVVFFSAEQGGRANPPASGYRPTVSFSGEADGERLWDFEFSFSGFAEAQPVAFGEEVGAVMRASSATRADVSPWVGGTFEVREGAKVVGRGRVVGIASS
jgi:translation elongation factor EF-Tu-like GTPase